MAIKDQCKKCRLYGTGKCSEPVFDGNSCAKYLFRINLEKNDSPKAEANTLVRPKEDSSKKKETDTITAEYLIRNTDIHGWLWFFLFAGVLSNVLSFIVLLAQFKQDLAEIGNVYLVLTDIVSGAMFCLLALYMVYSFWRRRPNAVFLAKTYVVANFVVNVIVLCLGGFAPSGYGSLGYALVFGVIWFLYFSFSSQVKQIIPPAYRKKMTIDYYIIGALIVVPMLFLALGIGKMNKDYEKEQNLIENVKLADNEYTDGKIVFTCPSGFVCEQYVLEDSGFLFFELTNNEGCFVTICSDYDTDASQGNFEGYWESWKDSDMEQYPSQEVIYEKRTVNNCPYYYRVVRYDAAEPVFWRYIILFDSVSGKACIVSSYDAGDARFMNDLLKSIRF